MTTIDLNSDLGESFGRWSLGDDTAMLDIVTSANIACGFHAGDPGVMRRTVEAAAKRGVAVGAHVAYPDLRGFGRRKLAIATDDLIADVMYQLGALQAMAHAAGTQVCYVKPHGALYNTIAQDKRQGQAIIKAIQSVDESLVLVALAGSPLLQRAQQSGIKTVAEAFADRAYTAEGMLVSRDQEQAVLTDPDQVGERMVRLVKEGVVESIEGRDVAIQADSICVHGDSSAAVAMATRVREALSKAGVRLKAFSDE